MKTVIIAAGGSGGHIYPGLAFAQALKRKDSALKIFFWGNKNGIESHLIPSHGYELLTTKIGRLNSNVSLLERVLTLFQLPFSILKGVIALRSKKPLFVIGMGGHSSAPIILAAKICRVQSFLWEPNVYPGLANRQLSRFVSESFVVFEESQKFLKSASVSTTGFLIREELEDFFVKKSFKNEFLNVLVFGGSQGSSFLNKMVSEMILSHRDSLKNFCFIHQTGTSHWQEFSNKYDGIKGVKAVAYIDNMPEQMKWADVVVCRSGTSTISELAAVGLTGIFIPLSTSSDNHQKKNADVLAKKKAGLMLLEEDLNSEIFFDTFFAFIQNRDKIKEMSKNIRSLYKPHSAAALVEKIYTKI